jgi:hypothetical protein
MNALGLAEAWEITFPGRADDDRPLHCGWLRGRTAGRCVCPGLRSNGRGYPHDGLYGRKTKGKSHNRFLHKRDSFRGW